MRLLNQCPPLLLSLSLFALLPACGEDGGDGNDPGGVRGCPGNGNVEPGSAKDLAPGERATGYLCPIGNQHWFRLQVPAGQPVLAVDLHNDTPLSAVKLSYTLRDGDGMTVIDQTPPPAATSNVKQQLRYSHCVPKAGTYYLQVQSFGNDGADVRNPFTLSYTTAADPDGGEPQNGATGGAVALTGAEQPGFIACKGDRDFYKVSVGDNALLDISLTTAAATPGLNLKYSLLDEQMGLVAEDGAPSGLSATSLRVVRVTPKAGTYYLVVADQAAGSNLQIPYSLKVASLPEPDGNERPVRNDVPAEATNLGVFACGGGASFGKTAFLASRADTDWYKVTVTGVSAACQAVLDVSAAWNSGGAGLRPQVSLIYPDAMNGAYPGTACTKDEECKLLRPVCGTCPSAAPCTGDDNRCSFLGNQCDRQPDKDRNLHCTGAAVCLPGGFCGALQYAKEAPLMGPTSARTAQPLTAAGTYYLRVRDFQSQGYDKDGSYSLAVRLSSEPPTEREPNNFYSPYSTPDSGIVRGNDNFVMLNKITLGTPVTGRISYERDQDFYFFDHPCPGQDCTLKVTYSTSGASRVLYSYSLEAKKGGVFASWPAPRPRTMPLATNGVVGGADAENPTSCLFAGKRGEGPYTLLISDLLAGGPLWDQDTTYTFTVTKAQDGCSAVCKAAPFNCGQ